MAKRAMKLWVFSAALMLAAGASAATPAKKPHNRANMTVKDIRTCMARNLVTRGALRDLALERYDKEGKVGSLRMKLFWKPSKTGGNRVNLRLLEPPAMLGSSYLLLQEGMNEEVYFYLPGADHALRITGQNMSEPLWGTDFSYGEIKEVLGLLATGQTIRNPDAKVADRAVYVLETETPADDEGYKKVVSYVDQKSCTLLKSEFFGKEDKPLKVLDADVSTLIQADKYWTLLGYTMSDLTKGTHTKLTLTDLSFDERMPDKLFGPTTFFESGE